ncbi:MULTISPECIES: phosphoribosyltransferase [unclassified Lebetimonas]|uniref:phosphoribosyltransferase n=1 Tax=unclassified Lebetimonas TaxID=2648158 RepID=UPI0004657C26|nr:MULTISPECIES: phosphoribosyltransferase family protein [unclassified Lebetimonas]
MFKNRVEAGKLLAKEIKKLKEEGLITDPVVVALPRGGIPVAAEIAKEINAPFDILFVKKIPAPGNAEFAIGSVSENGLVFINKDVAEKLGISDSYIQQIAMEKIQEIAKLREKYKIEPKLLEGKDVILVDDGVATGASMYLAAQSIVRDYPKSVIIAAPVAPRDEEVENMLKSVSHKLIILEKPELFMSVGRWYEDFHQLSDEEVINILSQFK